MKKIILLWVCLMTNFFCIGQDAFFVIVKNNTSQNITLHVDGKPYLFLSFFTIIENLDSGTHELIISKNGNIDSALYFDFKVRNSTEFWTINESNNQLTVEVVDMKSHSKTPSSKNSSSSEEIKIEANKVYDKNFISMREVSSLISSYNFDQNLFFSELNFVIKQKQFDTEMAETLLKQIVDPKDRFKIYKIIYPKITTLNNPEYFRYLFENTIYQSKLSKLQ